MSRGRSRSELRRTALWAAAWLAAAVLVPAGPILAGTTGSSTGPSAGGAPIDEVGVLRILFLGETRGNLVPCTCPDQPWGGLSRRVGYARAARDAGPGPLWVLHSGGFLPVGEVPLRDDPVAAERLVDLLLRSVIRAGIDVLALDHGEAAYLEANSPETWRRLAPHSLSADPPDEPIIRSWNGRSVAILALEESLDDDALESAAANARRKAELLIVLARADASTGRRVAERTGADLVILSRGARPPAPLRVGQSWMVGPGHEGKEIGELTLSLGPGGIAVTNHRLVPMDASTPSDPATEAEVRALLDEFGPGWHALVQPLE